MTNYLDTIVPRTKKKTRYREITKKITRPPAWANTIQVIYERDQNEQHIDIINRFIDNISECEKVAHLDVENLKKKKRH
jgi:hypothetical protein